ncbi:hypothetical protein BH10BAC4_BH10BAC4_10350 [soil metagenome]
MVMKIIVRSYEAHDTVALLELFYDTVHGINSKDYPPEHIDAWAPANPDFRKKQSRFKTGKTVVAQLDGKIVGFGNLENDHSSVGMLYVHKDHQRQGIATVLLAALEKKLRKRDVKTATLEASITAKPFFEKRGYLVVRENKKMLNGVEFLNYIMEKDLTVKEEKKDMKDAKEKSKEPKPFRWRDLFINKAFDLLIVVAGVSIAFQLNNLKLNSDQKSLEVFYLESMLGDLRKDKKGMEEIVLELKKDQSSLVKYTEKISQPDYPVDSLGSALFNLLSLETFTPNQNTYQMLVASNGLTAFSDRKIRAMTAEYYNKYTSISRFETVYTNVLYNVFEFFDPYADYSERKILDPTIVSKPQTKNLLLLSGGQLIDGIEAYTSALETGDYLIKAIEDRLRKER